MTCAEFKEVAALYALGALDPAERAACDAHLAEAKHDGCVDALAQAFAAVEAIGGDLPEVPPGPHVWKKVEERIGVSVLAARRTSALGAVGWAVAAVAAAAAILLLWDRRGKDQEIANLLAGQRDMRARVTEVGRSLTQVGLDRQACRAQLEQMEKDAMQRDQAMALLELPGTQLFALAPQKEMESYKANAVLHTGLKRASVAASGMWPVAGKTYQLWVIKGKQFIPAGFLWPDEKGRAVQTIEYAGSLPEGAPDAVAVSLEPAGGSEQPTPGAVILAGGPKGG